jgi:acyl carrier protein
MPESSETLKVVIEELADLLALDPGELSPATQVTDEAGGESIELLEFAFRIEKRLGIRLRIQDLDFKDLELTAQGMLSSSTLARLSAQYPFYPFASLAGKKIHNRLSLITVAGLASLIDHTRSQASSAESRPDSPAAGS